MELRSIRQRPPHDQSSEIFRACAELSRLRLPPLVLGHIGTKLRPSPAPLSLGRNLGICGERWEGLDKAWYFSEVAL